MAGGRWVFRFVGLPPEQVDASVYEIGLLNMMAFSVASAMTALIPCVFLGFFRGGQLLDFWGETSRYVFLLATAAVSAPGLALAVYAGYLWDVVILGAAGFVTFALAAWYLGAWKQLL